MIMSLTPYNIEPNPWKSPNRSRFYRAIPIPKKDKKGNSFQLSRRTEGLFIVNTKYGKEMKAF